MSFLSIATVTAYDYRANGTVSGILESAEKPRNQAVSGLLVHMGFVSKITS